MSVFELLGADLNAALREFAMEDRPKLALQILHTESMHEKDDAYASMVSCCMIETLLVAVTESIEYMARTDFAPSGVNKIALNDLTRALDLAHQVAVTLRNEIDSHEQDGAEVVTQ